MDTWTIVSEGTRTVSLDGREYTAKIEIAVADDDTDPARDFDFGDAAENAAYLARFESGELVMACVRVRARWRGLEGTDYLGACHVRAGNTADVLDTVHEHVMVDRAVAELRTQMREMRDAFQV